MRKSWVKWPFLIAGVYDAFLGVAFLLVPENIFRFYGVTPPNHMAYVQFPALLLIVFAVMFFQIASDPVRYRHMMLYGMGLKFSYCILAFLYEITSSIAFMWIPWAWFDLAFLILFVIAWNAVAPAETAV